jgi:hypothetical protein
MSFDYEDKEFIELNNRVAVIKTAIYDETFKSDNVKFLPFSVILNKIIILVQKNITFVLYKKVGNEFVRYYNFMLDKVSNSKFETVLNEEEEKEKFFETLFKMPSINDDYFLAVFYVRRTINDISFDHISSIDENYISVLLNNLFDAKYSYRYKQVITKSIDVYKDFSTNKEINFPFSDGYFSFLKNEMKNKIESGINEQINKVFNKINDSTKIINSLILDDGDEHYSLLSNIIFFVKDYTNIKKSDTEDRFYLEKRWHIDSNEFAYDYNLRMVIPQKQIEEIKSFFRFFDLKEAKNNPKFKSFSELSDSNYKVLANQLDTWFWSNLKNDRENFLCEIITILSTPLGKYSRSIADPVFQTGLTHFRHPFQDTGLFRSGVMESELENLFDLNQIHEDKLIDCKRIVICYYLFSNMYKNYSEKLTVVMNPIEINGSVFAVTLHMVEHTEDVNKSPLNDYWKAVFYFYYSIVKRIERHLRKNLKTFVVNFNCDVFFEELRSEVGNSFEKSDLNNGIDCEFSLLKHNATSYFFSLFLPYSYFKFSAFKELSEEIIVSILRDQGEFIVSVAQKNRFFSRYTGNKKNLGDLDFKDFENVIAYKNNLLNQEIFNLDRESYVRNF